MKARKPLRIAYRGDRSHYRRRVSNINQKVNTMNANELYDTLIDCEVVSAEALNLVVTINGFSEETLMDVVYATLGLTSVEQLVDELGLSSN